VADLWHATVWGICKEAKIEPFKIFPVRITTKSFFKSKAKRDTDNGCTANKLAGDGLVIAGILPDDTTDYVAEHLVLTPIFGHTEDKVVVTVETMG
jgi:hypothetical protein